MLELRTKFGNFRNFGNFGHISDGLRKQYSVRTECCNVIGSESLYIPCIVSDKCKALLILGQQIYSTFDYVGKSFLSCFRYR